MSSKLPLIERLSYGLGNFGINIMFGLTGTYLLYFYTDVYRVNAGIVAGVFLVARGVDAIFDPFLGLLIDRTKTRFGKHRPYLVGLAIPFAICGAVVFASPPLGAVAKIVFIYISYTALGLLYSGLSLPLNSMLPTLTRDPKERTETNVLRECMGGGATVGVGFIALPIVKFLGGPSPAKGFFALAVIAGVVSIGCLLITFFNTRERIEPTSSAQILSTRQSLVATRGNWPWISTMLVNFFFWVAFIAHTQSVIYYAEDVIRRPALAPTLMLTMLTMLVGTACSAVVANRIGKPLTGVVGSAIGAVGMAAISLSSSSAWLIGANTVAYFGLGLIGGLLFALMADAVDYGEWRNGFRAQGFLFAASSFGVKAGMSVGGASGAWLMARSGYVAGAPITAAIAASIGWGHIWIPVAATVTMGLSLAMFRTHSDYSAQLRRQRRPSNRQHQHVGADI